VYAHAVDLRKTGWCAPFGNAPPLCTHMRLMLPRLNQKFTLEF
jgi:hypothetical protein